MGEEKYYPKIFKDLNFLFFGQVTNFATPEFPNVAQNTHGFREVVIGTFQYPFLIF